MSKISSGRGSFGRRSGGPPSGGSASHSEGSVAWPVNAHRLGSLFRVLIFACSTYIVGAAFSLLIWPQVLQALPPQLLRSVLVPVSMIAALAYWGGLLLSAILVCLITYLSTSNLQAAGRSLSATPEGAVFAYFIPGPCFWRPAQVTGEMRAASMELSGDKPAPFIVAIWWISWLSGVFISMILPLIAILVFPMMGKALGGFSILPWVALAYLGPVGNLSLILSAALLLVVFGGLVRSQEQLAAEAQKGL